MQNIIQLLPDSIANQIAAGEVVQRPASVVKELLENAVDAGARSVQLVVRDAGRTLVQVIDDGKGMTETDARMSFERHATSKIRTSDDLFKIRTMGFRGEALASIAAVAQVEMRTRRADDELGTLVRIEGSDIKAQESVSCLPGTNLLVKNLFFNVPARRNFLKSNSVEMRHIIDEFQRVALANPEVAFSLFHNDQEVFNLVAGKLSRRIVDMFGKGYREQLAACDEETPYVSVHGYIGKPESARKTRNEQYFFVNNRYIKHSYLHHAVVGAYEGTIPDGHHPFYVLFIEIDPSHIDINIHPTKTEIKFDDERSIYAIVMAAVRKAIGVYNLSPSLDFELDVNFLAGRGSNGGSDAIGKHFASGARSGSGSGDALSNARPVTPSWSKTPSPSADRSADNRPPVPAHHEAPKKATPQNWQALFEARKSEQPASSKPAGEEANWLDSMPGRLPVRSDTPADPANQAHPNRTSAVNPSANADERTTADVPGTDAPADVPSLGTLLVQSAGSSPAQYASDAPVTMGSRANKISGTTERLTDELEMAVIQVKNRYLLTTVKSGLLLIDQRAAYERILYDQFHAALTKHNGASQQLLFPKTVTVSAVDYQLALDLRTELESVGFQFDELGAHTFVIRGVPAQTADEREEELFANLLAQLREDTGRMKLDRSEALARSLAKRSSARHQKPLSQTERRALVDQLFASVNPSYTPGGESIMSLLSLDKLSGLLKG
ncbi:DNA mismatch repair endonuclease MutL [Fibrella forsythiae]|uniref:DNA mismatch repair protein MutL n=1 Tax=Fibrella forsythiae TaxID=2817061 RepID=A0ABS3JHW2_9BACT|nr:DNA mismatch repair endonuclease MutL [Fibrella forsythiae]MBO0949583.1 DNA mismatch repair endonuclease MutL [Fibrella forsythiae]